MVTARRLLFLLAISFAPLQIASAQLVGKGLIINEIYIGSAAATSGATDQFIELYNPTQSVQYLDACMIVRFGATGGKLSGAALLAPVDAWKFPGRVGGKTLAIQPKAFVVLAASAKAFTGGLDLSTSAFETYTGSPLNDLDNPNSVNLRHLANGSTKVTDFALSATADAVVLTNGQDSVLTDGINASTVLDGVQYNTAWVAGTLPAAIDAGHTGGPNLKYGYALERNKVGVTTLNSTTDFGLQYPTPGSQHGTTPPPPPPAVVKVTDLMPFDLNRFVAYNQYDTATAGGTPSKSEASNTVFGSNITFNGEGGVAWVRDTSGNTGQGSSATADLHYAPTASGDIQVFADQSLVASAIPSGLGLTFTLPNKFVDYLKMSAGVGVSYPVTTGNGSATVSNIPLTITVTSTGKYRGIETNIRVPAGSFDTTYRFDISNLVSISGLGGLVSGNFTLVQSLWLRKGIGIIKSNTPIASTTIGGQPVQAGGTEKEMTSYGIATVNGVASNFALPSGISFYPDPAPDAINVQLSKPAHQILLYAVTGRMVRSFELAGGKLEAMLSVADIANGAYMARILFEDGTEQTERIVVQH